MTWFAVCIVTHGPGGDKYLHGYCIAANHFHDSQRTTTSIHDLYHYCQARK